MAPKPPPPQKRQPPPPPQARHGPRGTAAPRERPSEENFMRVASSRTANYRRSFRQGRPSIPSNASATHVALAQNAERDTAIFMEIQWDVRGPPGPNEGGPQVWKRPGYRESTGQWANNGGKLKDRWKIYKRMESTGNLSALQLEWYHPHRGGHWKADW